VAKLDGAGHTYSKYVSNYMLMGCDTLYALLTREALYV